MAVQQMQLSRPKAAVSVTAMARMVGLSRSRFYEYVKRGVFTWPVYSLATKRPMFTGEMQQDVVAARQTGIGCNGEYVLFYDKQSPGAVATPPARRQSKEDGLLDSLRKLGMPQLTAAQVQAAVTSVFPGGTEGIDESALLRMLYRHLRRPGGV